MFIFSEVVATRKGLSDVLLNSTEIFPKENGSCHCLRAASNINDSNIRADGELLMVRLWSTVS